MNDRSDEQIIKDFGNILNKIMEREGISFRELSALTGMNLGNLSDLALGKKEPKLITIVRLAEALGIPPSDLLPSS
jgi:HTH-type transcriptional regulator, competence development regulator